MSNMIEVETTDDISSGGFLETDGVYHVGIVDVNLTPVYRRGDRKGQYLENTLFEVNLEVMAGPRKGETVRVSLRSKDGYMNDNDQGKFAKQYNSRFFDVTCMTDRSNLGKAMKIDPTKSDGVTFIAKFSHNKKGYFGIDGLNIWHIDDPNAMECPRCAEAIRLTKKEHRREASYFGEIEKPKAPPASNGNGTGSAVKKPSVSVDDI